MGRLVVVTGMNGGGKSTVISNLAYALAKGNNTVGVFSCDMTYASIPYFFGVQIPADNSIGKIMRLPNPASKFIETGEQTNVFVSATARGENCFMHEPPQESDIVTFLEKLCCVFDYVLVEAGEAMKNFFSAVAISVTNLIINVTPATVQGCMFELSSHELLSSYNPKAEIVHVMNKAKQLIPVSDFKISTGIPFNVLLPYCQYAEAAESNGCPVFHSGAGGKRSKEFNDAIIELAKLVIGEQPETKNTEEVPVADKTVTEGVVENADG